MTENHKYIQRCFDLAIKGAGSVSPNPLVGAVLVYKNRIIGEGWHQKYGTAHAEVNAVNSVKPEDRHLISKSRLYVSLEPCCIFGKTPPCTNLILENKIPEVIVSALDQTPGVDGKGIQILRENGVKVTTGILEKQGKKISQIRNTFVTKKRPYIILKYAQTKDGFLGKENEQFWITNSFSKRLVHKWRSQSDSILVGTKTVLTDNPSLTTRNYFGKSPLRIVMDKELKLPQNLNIFDNQAETWIINEKIEKEDSETQNRFLKMNFNEGLLNQILTQLFDSKKSTLIVEGGTFTLQQFIDQNLWDETRIFTGNKYLGTGIKAPKITGTVSEKHQIGGDTLTIMENSFAGC